MTSNLKRTVRGMRDLLPDETELLRFVELKARIIARLYGYREVITPIIEHYDLLAAKIGEENRKRMYVFKDLGGRKVALRPEFTASIARLVTTKMATYPKPIRLFSTGSLYRYDEPQFGRYREFWQANYELIGSSKPEADVEVLSVSESLLKETGLEDYYFKIGHVGVLRGILASEGLNDSQQNHIMQLLDKKMWNDALKMVRDLGVSRECLKILETLFGIRDKDWRKALNEMKSLVKGYENALTAIENLEEILDLTIEENATFQIRLEPGFARGLEYYTGMIFEIYVPEMNVALGGGGRYDKLIEIFGGESTPAAGFALGIDRTALAITIQRPDWKPPNSFYEGVRVLVLPVNDSVKGYALKVSSKLRKEKKISVEMEVMGRTVSRALSDAARRGITHVIIVGPRELERNEVVLRDMRRKEQKTLKIDAVVRAIKETAVK